MQGISSPTHDDHRDSGTFGPITVITEKEQEAIQLMETRLDAVRTALKINEQKQGNLQREQKEQENEIDTVFDELERILVQQRSALKSKLTEMINTERDVLQSQARLLMNHSESLTAGKKQQNAVIANFSKIDKKDRERTVQGITVSVLKEIDDDELKRKRQSVELMIDREAILKVQSTFNLFLIIHFVNVQYVDFPHFSSKTTSQRLRILWYDLISRYQRHHN